MKEEVIKMAGKIPKKMLEKTPQLEQIFAAIEEFRENGKSTVLCPKCDSAVTVVEDRKVGYLETTCQCGYCKYRMSWNPR